MMYKIKQKQDDFIVKEIMELKFDKNGRYSYYLLKKTGCNTIDAINAIARRWRISSRFINFAGTKDKNAVTEQYISISRGPEKDLPLKNIELKYLGRGNERLNLGSHQGNLFRIVVRNITRKPQPIKRIVNYYGSQRFGINNNNDIIGKAIITRDFEKAVRLIDDPEPNRHIENSSHDYVGALKRLPKKLLQLYVHAYQSRLWNEMAMQHASDRSSIMIPLMGFNTQLDEKARGILSKEGITASDFLIRQMPELSLEGDERDLFIQVNDIVIGNPEEDELNLGKKKVFVSFRLAKGSYATEVIRQMFGSK